MSGTLAAYRALDDGRERAEMYRLWRAGHAAGFTHPKSLDVMGSRASAHTEDARLWLLRGTGSGRDVAGLVGSGGRRFDDFERTLLILGDETGQLDQTLALLADFFTKKHQLALWVKKQMAYPFFTALAACFVAPLPLLVFGQPVLYAVTAFTGAALVFTSAGSAVMALYAWYGRKPPLVRARMARALAIAVEAGLPLPRAIRLAADASASGDVQTFVRARSERLLATSSMTESLAGCPHLTPDFIATLATAERTGDFSVLRRMAELYEDGFR
jgi:type II secretory pathway component PulF